MPSEDHQEIQDAYKQDMNIIASALDRFLNSDAKGEDRKLCFTLLVAEFGNVTNGCVNYISNGDREGVLKMLEELIGRFKTHAANEAASAAAAKAKGE